MVTLFSPLGTMTDGYDFYPNGLHCKWRMISHGFDDTIVIAVDELDVALGDILRIYDHAGFSEDHILAEYSAVNEIPTEPLISSSSELSVEFITPGPVEISYTFQSRGFVLRTFDVRLVLLIYV